MDERFRRATNGVADHCAIGRSANALKDFTGGVGAQKAPERAKREARIVWRISRRALEVAALPAARTDGVEVGNGARGCDAREHDGTHRRES